MMLIEAVACAVIGGLIGCAVGVGMLYIAPKIMMSLGLRLVMRIPVL